MKKLVAIAALLFSTCAFADGAWGEYIWESYDGDKMYISEIDMRSNGDFGVWVMFDLTKPDDRGFLSYQIYQNISCAYKSGWQSDQKLYRQHLGRGKPIAGFSSSPSKKFGPESFQMALYNSICKKSSGK